MEWIWPCVFYSPVAEVFGHGVVLGAVYHKSRIRNALLLALQHPAGSPATPGELHRALASRSDLDLAVGTVARSQHSSLHEALVALVRAASHGDRKLHAVAVTTSKMQSRLPQAAGPSARRPRTRRLCRSRAEMLNTEAPVAWRCESPGIPRTCRTSIQHPIAPGPGRVAVPV